MRAVFLLGIAATAGIALLAQACASAPKGGPEAAEKIPTTEDFRVKLSWQTETESEAFGYYVYRADEPGAEPKCINDRNPVHAAGTTTIPGKYTFYDLNVEEGKTYYYKLKSVDLDESFEWIVGAEKPVEAKPKKLTAEEIEDIKGNGTAYRKDL